MHNCKACSYRDMETTRRLQAERFYILVLHLVGDTGVGVGSVCVNVWRRGVWIHSFMCNSKQEVCLVCCLG